jgi:hypothetical protein
MHDLRLRLACFVGTSHLINQLHAPSSLSSFIGAPWRAGNEKRHLGSSGEQERNAGRMYMTFAACLPRVDIYVGYEHKAGLRCCVVD